MNPARLVPTVLLLLCFAAVTVWAGGPLVVGGPAVGNRAAFGIDGQAFTWNPVAMPIQYRVDPGPMATTSSGNVVVGNSEGLNRLRSMFAAWQAAPNAAVSFTNAGDLLPSGAYTGGDVKTLEQYNAIMGSCRSGVQSPVVFDADGTLIAALGLPKAVIGFASACAFDTSHGYITAASILMNGAMQDGVRTSSNYETTANQFDEAITHEMGHFLGLDHSQINVDLYISKAYPCDLDRLAGLPLMFPVEMCQARKDAGLPLLAPDDLAWISTLYPNQTFQANYAMISGTVYFGGGVDAVQGVNVIARRLDDPTTVEDESRRVAVSAISGYLFTGNPGQSVTGDNDNGDRTGSRNAKLIGYYQMYLPPGTYTVEVESVSGDFDSDSGMGPLNPPCPILVSGVAKFWNQNSSAFDFPKHYDTITLHGGDKVSGIDIILNYAPARFDANEDEGALLDSPVRLPFLTLGDSRA